MKAAARAKNLLCVSNYPSDNGYAWVFIEGLFAALADALSARSISTYVAYPSIPAPPVSLAGSAAIPVVLSVDLERLRSWRELIDFIRAHDIGTVYLTDRPVWSPAFAALHLAGVDRIIVHDHTSGDRTAPTGLKRLLKRARMAIPLFRADHVVAVSDFVLRRKLEIDLVPPSHVTRIWNSHATPPLDAGARARLRKRAGLAENRAVIICACRATHAKGVHHLLRAFDALVEGMTPAGRPALVYFGEGPAYEELVTLRDSLSARDDMILGGFEPAASDLTGGADISVSPSTWAEAFGLAVLEPMTRGVPVVATAVGGIPEIVVDGETGLLVPPGDEQSLTVAMRRLLEDPAERRRMGDRARQRAEQYFSPAATIEQLLHVITGRH